MSITLPASSFLGIVPRKYSYTLVSLNLQCRYFRVAWAESIIVANGATPREHCTIYYLRGTRETFHMSCLLPVLGAILGLFLGPIVGMLIGDIFGGPFASGEGNFGGFLYGLFFGPIVGAIALPNMLSFSIGLLNRWRRRA